MPPKKLIRKCTWCKIPFLGIRNTCSADCLSKLRSYNAQGNKNPMYGSERYGKMNPNWLGGKKFEEYTEAFNKKLKNQVKRRDNYRCWLCGKKNKDCISKTGICYGLQVHHIDYNKANNNLNNLVALCNRCHTKTNFNRAAWMEILKNDKFES